MFGRVGSLLLCGLFSSCGGYSLVAVLGLLIAMASLAAEHGLWGWRVTFTFAG